MTLGADARTVLVAAGAMFLIALALGVWKHQQMTTSEDHLAHPYVDTAHRAALLYSFATLLVATFVQFSGWSEPVDLISAGVLCFFFQRGRGLRLPRGGAATPTVRSAIPIPQRED